MPQHPPAQQQYPYHFPGHPAQPSKAQGIAEWIKIIIGYALVFIGAAMVSADYVTTQRMGGGTISGCFAIVGIVIGLTGAYFFFSGHANKDRPVLIGNCIAICILLGLLAWSTIQSGTEGRAERERELQENPWKNAYTPDINSLR